MRLLFLCTHNACRSILAEAITRKLAGDRIRAASAGSAPRGQVHPLTLENLERRGYGTDGLASRSWDSVSDFSPDAVITVCDQAAGESCPIWFGEAVKAHWGLPDPTKLADGKQVADAFSDVITTLEERIGRLLSRDLEQMNRDLEQMNREQIQSLLDGMGEEKHGDL